MRAGATLEPTWSPPPGRSCGRTAWVGCRFATWRDGRGSPHPPSTRTSSRRTPSSTPCSRRRPRASPTARPSPSMPTTRTATWSATRQRFVDFCTSDVARYQLLFQHLLARLRPVAAGLRARGAGPGDDPGDARAQRRTRPGALGHLDRADDRAGRPADRQRPRRGPVEPARRRGRGHVPRPLRQDHANRDSRPTESFPTKKRSSHA